MSQINKSVMIFALGGLFMGAIGIYTMHTKYGELCGEINWQSPMCQKIKEHW